MDTWPWPRAVRPVAVDCTAVGRLGSRGVTTQEVVFVASARAFVNVSESERKLSGVREV